MGIVIFPTFLNMIQYINGLFLINFFEIGNFFSSSNFLSLIKYECNLKDGNYKGKTNVKNNEMKKYK